jgi:branched-chain amino acid transport system substrate-binding protein
VTFPDVAVGYMRSFRTVTTGLPAFADFLSVGSNGLFSAAFLELGLEDPADPKSPTIGEGMYIVNLDLAPDTPQYKEFQNLFTIHFPLEDGKTELAGYTANQFDAIALLCLAIERAGGALDRVKIRDALYEVSRPPGTAFSPAHLGEALYAIRLGQDIDYDGASGPVDFDDYGEVLSSYVVYKVSSGAFAKIPGDTIEVEDLE